MAEKSQRIFWEGWNKLFKIRGLIDPSKDINYISANEIKKYTLLEPRIMAKFDRYEDQPEIFRKYGIFILPVTNGQYVLVKGQGYHCLEPIKRKVQEFTSRLPIVLSTQKEGIGEMQRVDWAYNSGLLGHFTGINNLYLTIRGRKFCPEFTFRIGKLGPFKIKGVQVEIDGGFESQKNLVLLEAKIGNPENFIIRQLFYPIRFWHAKLPTKPAKAIFFTYLKEQNTYNIWEYKFSDINDYSSIELEKSARYHILEKPADLISAEEIIDLGEIRKKEGWIIPQANDLDKVAELTFKVSEGKNNADEIAKYFQFETRQSSYYREAAEALGLVVLEGSKYYLTDIGKEFVDLDIPDRNKMLCRLLFELPLFNEIMKELYLKRRVTTADITEIIRKRSNLSGSTPMRRAQSILAWFKWVQERLGILRVDRDKITI